MSLVDESISSIDKAVKSITDRHAAAAKHHARCVADGEKFKQTLRSLAVHNPWALKEYVERGDDIDVRISNGRISGYYREIAFGYDPDLSSYIGNSASQRVRACDSLVR